MFTQPIHVAQVAAAGGPMQDLLDDFKDLYSMEWPFMLTILGIPTGFFLWLLSFIMARQPACLCAPRCAHRVRPPQIMTARKNQVLFYWKLLMWSSAFVTLGLIVYLIEPRPAFWIEMIRSVRRWIRTRTGISYTDTRARIRRWWRWRRKYGATKLNV